MTRNLKTLAVVSLTIGLAAACGGGSSKPAASSATSAAAPPSAAAAAPTSAAAAATTSAAAVSSATGSAAATSASAAPASVPAISAPPSPAAATGGSTTGCSNAAVAVNKATNASPQSQLVFSIDLQGGCSTVVITSGIAKGDAAAVTLCNTVAPVAYANGVGAVKILATDGTSSAASGKKGSACVSG